jgi:ribulose-5-phosphate 4-epimerase/fuculose-1-phosphate aldolase
MSELGEDLREKVALSCRILAMEGLIENILGHVSARTADRSQMWIRCRSEDEQGVRYTTAETVRQVDFDGNGSHLEGRYRIPNELPIHGEIFKQRPEVGCVIHAHPKEALICGITGLEFRPVFGAYNIQAMRMALDGIPIFERSYLVNRPELAAPLIAAMGGKNVCLMKGHGLTVTGKTVEEATVRALNFNTLARVTLQVAQVGRGAPEITREDIERLPDLGSTFNDLWMWRSYVRKLQEEDHLLSRP